MMELSDKILTLKELENDGNHRLVLTNGGFSVLHYGHIQYLHEAKSYGDKLIVAVNTNESIYELKSYKPPSSDRDRLLLLAALQCVDAVIPFDGDLTEIIKTLKPAVYVKGGDYTLDTINQEERKLLESLGAEIKFTKFHKGYSATNFIERARDVKFRGEE